MTQLYERTTGTSRRRDRDLQEIIKRDDSVSKPRSARLSKRARFRGKFRALMATTNKRNREVEWNPTQQSPMKKKIASRARARRARVSRRANRGSR